MMSIAAGPVTPASEWLLDNFHLVASEVLEVRRNLPPGYYRELPKLALRELAGHARIYALAEEIIRHSDSAWTGISWSAS